MSLGAELLTSRYLSGTLLRGTGQVLYGETRDGKFALLDPDTAGELQATRLPAFVLSTEREATDGHIVMQEWDLSRVDSVGVPILWAHNSRGEVLGQWREAKVQSLDMLGRSLVARADFDLGLPMGAEKEGQVRRGYVRAVSIGWQRGDAVRRGELPKDDPRYRDPTEDDCGHPGEGLVMGTPKKPNRLMETSLVGVPADDGAYAIERAFARADDHLRSGAPMAGRSLDELLAAVAQHPAARAWIARLIGQEVDRRLAARSVHTPPAPRSGIARFKR